MTVKTGTASASTASDVICSLTLGTYIQGEDHQAAVAHIAKVRPGGPALADSLRTLLTMKTRAGYSHEHVNATDRKRAGRAAQKLLSAARQRRI
ncbi:MAG TPA: hypothetical protein VFW38_05290 [Solirubrobacteraceae bacterium]|nr:hypothetical protein [Solirubrobacteraceae bacterium]